VRVEYSTEQNLRAMVGPRLTFTADPLEIYFRAVVGYDHLSLSLRRQHRMASRSSPDLARRFAGRVS